jgi:hypothetical protein
MRCIILSVVLLAWALPASAEGPNPERAQRFVNIATKMFKAKDYEAALVALRTAEPLAEGTPAQAVIRFNIGRTCEELGLTDAAIKAYEIYLKTSDKGPRRVRAREAIKGLEASRSGRLQIDCGGVAASVFVDGFPGGDCPWHWDTVAPGTYKLRVISEGYGPIRREVAVEPAKTTRLMLTLRPMKAAAADSGGPPWGWIAAGVGVVGLGTGAVMHGMALGTVDEVEAMGPGSARDDLTSTYETERTLAYVGYGIGVVALGTAAAIWLLDAPESQAAWVPTGNGFMVRF